jgi:hypothetical protein
LLRVCGAEVVEVPADSITEGIGKPFAGVRSRQTQEKYRGREEDR